MTRKKLYGFPYPVSKLHMRVVRILAISTLCLYKIPNIGDLILVHSKHFNGKAQKTTLT